MGQAEAIIEQYLKKKVKELDGIAYKFTSPGRRNVPDELCVFPTGFVAFVECKTENGVFSKGQEKEFERLTALSQPVFVVHNRADVDEVIKLIASLLLQRQRK